MCTQWHITVVRRSYLLPVNKDGELAHFNDHKYPNTSESTPYTHSPSQNAFCLIDLEQSKYGHDKDFLGIDPHTDADGHPLGNGAVELKVLQFQRKRNDSMANVTSAETATSTRMTIDDLEDMFQKLRIGRLLFNSLTSRVRV